MAAIYNSICYEADTLLLCLTRLTQKEIQYKLKIEKLMHEGFFDIAKARYIMGSTCVTKMQLPTEHSNPIQPVATVCRAKLNNHWVYHIHRKDNLTGSDTVSETASSKYRGKENDFVDQRDNDFIDNKDIDSETVSVRIGGEDDFDSEKIIGSNVKKVEAEFRSILETNPKSLKKSKIAFPVRDRLYHEYNEEFLDEMSTDSETSLASVTDPIRLFGVLVPNTLKRAQTIFVEVVQLIAKCSTLQSELKEVFQKYSHIMKVKELIEFAAKEIKMDITKPKVYWTPSEGTSDTYREPLSESEDDKYDVNVKKSIRSVFYDLDALEEDDTELYTWSRDGKDSSVSEV